MPVQWEWTRANQHLPDQVDPDDEKDEGLSPEMEIIKGCHHRDTSIYIRVNERSLY